MSDRGAEAYYGNLMGKQEEEVFELSAENTRLKIEIERLRVILGNAKEALTGMCEQFAFWSDRGGYYTGGLSALEYAFRLLDWADPHICEAAQCDEPGCKKQATCGFPTDNGSRRTCGPHMRAAEAATEEKQDA